jgi:hypothetical protein
MAYLYRYVLVDASRIQQDLDWVPIDGLRAELSAETVNAGLAIGRHMNIVERLKRSAAAWRRPPRERLRSLDHIAVRLDFRIVAPQTKVSDALSRRSRFARFSSDQERCDVSATVFRDQPGGSAPILC